MEPTAVSRRLPAEVAGSQTPLDTLRARIEDSARKLLGTPWQHQGRLPGVGIDCVGLGICIGQDLGLPVYDMTAYPEDPDPEVLLEYMRKNCDEIEGPGKLGEFALCSFTNSLRPQHLFVFSRRGMIHALRRRDGSGRVFEHRITPDWRKRIHSYWRYRWQPSH